MKLQERVILHCDANNFFASVETIINPKCKNMPVAVTGNPKKRTGIVLAKNELAKLYGVKTGDTIGEAKLKCPNLVCLSPNMPIYEQYSQKLQEIYYEYTDQIESFGIDECWLDITDSLNYLNKSPKEIADELRLRVKNELNLTISVGISFCKLFAKLASDMKKPDATTEISRQDYKKILYPLELTEIIGIGRRLKNKFNKFNVFKLGDIIKINDEILKAKFGKVGIEIKNALLGNQCDPVINNSPIPKSVGNGTTTIRDVASRDEIKSVVIYLSEMIARRLREKSIYTACVHISVKTCNFKRDGHEKHLKYNTNNASDIAKEAMTILDSFWQYDEKIRAIRVSCGSISKNFYEQTSLFSSVNTKNNSLLNNTIDKILNKYGSNALQPAVLLTSDYINKKN